MVLPNGTAYTFQYSQPSVSGGQNYGNLIGITLPSGGALSYSWLTHFTCNAGGSGRNVSSYVASRSLNANDGSGPQTWTYSGATVTDAAGNDVVHTMTALGTTCNYYETQTQYYQGSSTSGTLVKTVSTGYSYNTMAPGGPTYLIAYNTVPSSITTQWPNGRTKRVERVYDSGFTFTDVLSGSHTGIYGKLVTEREYDYGAVGSNNWGSLSRQKQYQYIWQSNSNYLTANLLNLKTSDIGQDGSGNTCSQIQFAYDDPARRFGSGISTQRTSPPASVRGNLSSMSHWVSSTPCQSGATGTFLTTYTNVYDTGSIYQTIDARGNTTTLSYSPTFVGTHVTQVQHPNTATQHNVYSNFDFNTGRLASSTDENGNVSTFSYDAMWRIASITPPSSGGAITFTYTDTPGALSVERKEQIDSSRTTDQIVYFDGFGRETSRATANDESTPWDKVDSCYEGRGLLAFESYPYQSSTPSGRNCSGIGDSYSYDALSRVASVVHSDGSSLTKTYVGPATSELDEGNGLQQVQTISQVDGLDRLSSVCEVSNASQLGITGTPSACGLDVAGTGFLSTYQYNPLNNLTQVTQGGLNSRSFTYDSLSHLITATNPESGTTCYGVWSNGQCVNGYDANGNLIYRTRPAPNQAGGATVTATMSYDQLNRLTGISYSDSTPPVTFNYDEGSAFGISLTNTIGEKSSEYTGSSSSKLSGAVFSYDNTGRVVNNSQCTPQNCAGTLFPVTYGYDLAGDLLTGTNGVGVTISNSYNRATRVTGTTSSFADGNHPGTLLSALQYNAFGAPQQLSLGNGVNESYAYTPRGWEQSLTATQGSTTVYSLSLTNPSNGQMGYSGDGNVLYANDSVNGNWSYSYDPMNRLVSASSNSQAFTYAYDRFGNRWQQNVTLGSGPAPSYTFDANNHIIGSGISYDAAGNVTNDGTHSYTYDAENRIASVDAGGTASYVYDGGGERIRKTSSSGTVDYVYDLGGHVVAELSSTGSWNRGEVFVAGRHLATYVNSTTYFDLTDWLTSERVRTGVSGMVAETCQNLPFGDGQSCTGTDLSPLHFTGKQRDTETGLDEFPARYYSSTQGRWLSPDWSSSPTPIPYANLFDPRTLNLYAYVGNDPTNHPDPDGHSTAPSPCPDASKGCETQQSKQQEAAAVAAATVTTGPAMSEVDKVAKPLIESAAKGGRALEVAVDVARAATVPVIIVTYMISPQGGDHREADMEKHLSESEKAHAAEPQPDSGGARQGNGRGGRQKRLNELANDQKLNSAHSGWLRNEKRHVSTGNRSSLRVPPGTELAHRRGQEARKGYDYSHSDLQEKGLHQTQHEVERRYNQD